MITIFYWCGENVYTAEMEGAIQEDLLSNLELKTVVQINLDRKAKGIKCVASKALITDGKKFAYIKDVYKGYCIKMIK